MTGDEVDVAEDLWQVRVLTLFEERMCKEYVSQRLREWPIEDCPRSIRQLGQAAGVRALVDLVARIKLSSDWFVEILDPLIRNWISLQVEENIVITSRSRCCWRMSCSSSQKWQETGKECDASSWSRYWLWRYVPCKFLTNLRRSQSSAGNDLMFARPVVIACPRIGVVVVAPSLVVGPNER